jgi:hypothetical protein
MPAFRRLNILTGWAVFAIALVTYTLTVERTASFWDCGEFIACAFKLQVPHPPGAPFFLLIGRLFSMLSLGDVTKVAYWVNMASVTASAFSILFLFWTITMLAQKLMPTKEENYTTADTLILIGTGAVGALAYTFSDTFWFSAVEAEVYGMSSFFTAIVVWAALRWERIEDDATANRWLILIAYLTGLSIGVHLLNLVTLPALALLYYYKKAGKVSFWGGVVAFFGGLVVLAIINSGIIPGLPSAAFVLERLFVNAFGLPFGSGMLTFFLFFIALLTGGIVWSIRQRNALLNTGLLALAFVLIGYASYVQVLVRSGYNPPINENDPSDALNFISYLKREQYGSRSLTYGPVFTARPTGQKDGDDVYRKEGQKYVAYDKKPIYTYDDPTGDAEVDRLNVQMLFPRIYSSQQNHPQLYRQMLGIKEGERPTMGHNLGFFFSYQLGHMYFRYLLWNFVGRESDAEGAGALRPWDTNAGVPDALAKNKGRDNYYMLPLLLALFGMVFQYYRRRRDFLIVGLLFLFTGVALQVFLNSPPSEPRERDYIYVGSFYFFAIWLGLGVMAIAEGLRNYLKNDVTRNATVVGLSLLVPVLMGSQTWDNHDRSNRYHSVDFAKNLLNSCAPNAILFTGGDNDTFPLWYAQEVEGFRRDVRVCNLSLLGTDWYIAQMKRATYESAALPVTLERNQFITGKNDIVPFYEMEQVKTGIDLNQYIKLIRDDSPAIQVPLTTGQKTSILPSSVLILNLDKAAIDKAGFVPATLRPYLKDTLQWTIGKSDLYKPDLIMLDIIANNNWQRPIYFSSTLSQANYLGLKDHMQLEGYAYRLMPVGIQGASEGYVNADVMYKNMMTKMAWREMDNPTVYYDETYKGSPVVSARIAFFKLADQLIRENRKAEAKQALQRSLAVLPDKSIPYDQISSNYVRFFFELGDAKQAMQIAETMATRADQNLTYLQQSGQRFGDSNADFYTLQALIEACKDAKQPQAAAKFEAIIQKHAAAFEG